MKLNKRDVKAMLKAGARARGIALSAFRAELQDTIEEQRNSDNPEIQENFRKCFGNRIPTPEEYICTISNRTKIKF